MKNYLFIALALGFANEVNAQTCMIEKDSISSGSGAGEQSKYIYNGNNILTRVDNYAASSSTIDDFDTLYYTGNQLDSVVTKYAYSGQTYTSRKRAFVYTNNKISRIESSFYGQSPHFKAHDVAYDGNGNVASVTYDLAAKVGTPDGFTGDYKNLVYDGSGNVTSYDMVFYGTTYSFASITYDGNANVDRLRPHLLDASLIAFKNMPNNILTANRTGQSADLTYNLTYNNEGEVHSKYEGGTFGNKKTLQFFYSNCGNTVSANEIPAPITVSVYPNPSSGTINVQSASTIINITVYDILGNEVLQTNNSTFNLNSSSTGVYFIKVQNNQGVFTKSVAIQ